MKAQTKLKTSSFAEYVGMGVYYRHIPKYEHPNMCVGPFTSTIALYKNVIVHTKGINTKIVDWLNVLQLITYAALDSLWFILTAPLVNLFLP